MAKLDPDRDRLLWELQSQILDIIDRARTLEFWLFDSLGETDDTIVHLNELQRIVNQATERFLQFPTLQIRIANAQYPIPVDIMNVVERAIANNQQKIPALQRSTQEIEREWR